MRSQLTVIANSSKVRVICMPANCLDYLSEPVRKEIRQKILSLFIPIPEQKPQQEEETQEEKKKKQQMSFKQAKLQKLKLKREKSRQEKQAMMDKIIFKCKHSKKYESKPEGIMNTDYDQEL